MSQDAEHRHRERMQALVEFTSTSFDTDSPSPFGSAVYDSGSGVLVARAYDTVIHECDPTRHAEVNAIREATRCLQRLSLRGHVLYSTCEPCPMCMSACIWAEIDTVVYGASTMEDAHPYWPQSSDMTPSELISRMRLEPACVVVPHVERSLCRKLFEDCDRLRTTRSLQQPPHRAPG